MRERVCVGRVACLETDPGDTILGLFLLIPAEREDPWRYSLEVFASWTGHYFILIILISPLQSRNLTELKSRADPI